MIIKRTWLRVQYNNGTKSRTSYTGYFILGILPLYIIITPV